MGQIQGDYRERKIVEFSFTASRVESLCGKNEEKALSKALPEETQLWTGAERHVVVRSTVGQQQLAQRWRIR